MHKHGAARRHYSVKRNQQCDCGTMGCCPLPYHPSPSSKPRVENEHKRVVSQASWQGGRKVSLPNAGLQATQPRHVSECDAAIGKLSRPAFFLTNPRSDGCQPQMGSAEAKCGRMRLEAQISALLPTFAVFVKAGAPEGATSDFSSLSLTFQQLMF